MIKENQQLGEKLGFGLMRLPLLPGSEGVVDSERVCEMVDYFMNSGFNYFDTAYFYHGEQSERMVKECLVNRYSRSSFILADKMPLRLLENGTAIDQEHIFGEQLERCGVDYFDYYLLHNLNLKDYEIAERVDSFSFLQKKQEEGKIRKFGFSFHGRADALDKILNEHPEMQFVQLQINYLDWEDERVQARKGYEVAVRHGKPIIVMEPIKGGLLAKEMPNEAKKLLGSFHPDWTPAAWALRFAAGLEHVIMVLSGMSTIEQMKDNVQVMRGPIQRLSEEEQRALEKTANLLVETPLVPCTKCRYCVDGCPEGIPIPELFALRNADRVRRRKGLKPQSEKYNEIVGGNRASKCINCMQCERACPQGIQITKNLKRIVEIYEKGFSKFIVEYFGSDIDRDKQ